MRPGRHVTIFWRILLPPFSYLALPENTGTVYFETSTFIYHFIPNYSQQDATFLDLFISKDAIHISGGSSAHHQEHTTVHTASGIVKAILLLAATVVATKTLYMFQEVPPPIIRSTQLYIQRQVLSNQYCC